MALKTKKQNMIMDFESIDVKDSKFSLNFHKTIKDGVTTVTGNPHRDGSDVGFISYSPADEKFFFQINHFSSEDLKHLPDILKTAANAVVEIMEE